MEPTPDRKLFLGGRLKRLRRDLTLTQTAMAADLGVSPSYLNHIERNQRPVSAQLLLRLADTYDVDLRTLGPSGGPATESELTEAFADPLFQGLPVPRHEIVQLAEDQPAAADALLRLYRAFSDRRARDRAEADVTGGAGDDSPADWVREYVQARRNHFPELDTLGEALAEALEAEAPGESFEARGRARLLSQHGLTVRTLPAEVMVEWTRRYDPHRKRLLLSEILGPSSRAFAVAFQLALSEHDAELTALTDAASAPDEATRRLLKVSLTNTLAAAMLMPYAAFQQTAEATGYDLARLQARFGVSFEQACHRLSTLQRPGAAGLPVFFCRVDMAGNITKRHSATRLQFARFGGACPLWVVHEAVAIPDRVLVQLAEMPDGTRYVSMAKGLVKPSGSFARPPRRYAVALGCEESHAADFVYADALRTGGAATPIGTSCRICPRTDCDQRAFPPAASIIEIDPDVRETVPYAFR